MPGPVDDAIANLRAARVQTLTDLRRIEDALLALGGLAAQTEDGQPAIVARTSTLKDRVLRLMEDDDRFWTAPEVMEALRAERYPLREPDPIPGIRSSFNKLRGEGYIKKTAYGVYKARKWTSDDEPDAAWDHQDDLSEFDMRLEADAARSHYPAGYDPSEEPF